MRLSLAAFVAGLFASGFALGQAPEIPPEAVRSLADDLAEIQALLEKSQQAQSYAQASDFGPWRNFDSLRITSKYAAAKAGAADNASTIATLKAGATVKVLDRVGLWYAVQLPTTDSRLGSGWIKAADVAPFSSKIRIVDMQQTSGTSVSAFAESINRALMEKIAELRERYKSNAHFVAKGFTVNLGRSPSVSISFEFK